MNLLKKLLNNRTVQNAWWMIAEQFVQMGISLVLGVLTARYLGPSNYGIINYCSAFVIFFTTISTLGLEGIVVKELVNHRESEGEIIGTCLMMRVIASILSIISICLILLVLNPGDILVMKVGLIQSLVMIFRAFELMDFWFQSYLQSKYVAIIKSISYVLVAVYKVFILATDKSVEWFAFSTTLDFLIIAVLVTIVYYKKGGHALTVSLKTAKGLISQSYHFILSGLIITVYNQMDKVMIGQFLGEKHVGLYSAALTICNYWVLIPVAIINSCRPTIMERKKTGDDNTYLVNIHRLYFVLIWSGIGVSVLVSVLSKFILGVLYGPEYISAAPVLSIAIWFTTFSVLGTARGIWIMCENLNEYVKKIVLWGAIINFVLNAILIPIIGINGAAIATLVTQIFNCLFAPMIYKKTRIHTKYIIRAFLGKNIR